MKNILPLSSDDFGLFQELLVEVSGLYFEEDRNQSLHLALWQRLQHRSYDSYREYYNLLKYHPEGRLELRELLDLITIGETYFFRNRAQFDVLMGSVLPMIMQRKAASRDKTLRVWSAGCSRGAEAYSIAIAVAEVFPFYKDWTISILGTDINRNGLASAKEAIYNERDVGQLPRECLDKYFKIRGSSYLLNSDVREFVQFEYHNVVKDPCVDEKMLNLDLLFCRNVTIYFDGQTTRRVIEKFYNCLAPEGFLFLGHAETLWQVTDLFESMEFPQSIIYKKRLGPVQEDRMKPFMAFPEIRIESLPLSAAHIPPLCRVGSEPACESGIPGPRPETSTSASSPFSALRVSKSSTEPVGPEKGESPPSSWGGAGLIPLQKLGMEECRGPTLPSLAQATLLANEANYKEAVEILIRIIEADNLSVEAHYLLGLISYKNNNLKEAETQFRKVLYVNPDSVLAYFNLGNVYLFQGKFGEAERAFRNAIWLLDKGPKDEQIRDVEDFTVEYLLRACRNNLAEISKRGG
jgi:chemotaxis protein methyltransferase CheR